MKQCNAITRTGARCQLPAQANDRCHWHGGLLPAPLSFQPEAPEQAKWSNVLPQHLLQRYSSTDTDPHYRSLRSEIALLDARIEELLRGVGPGRTPTDWTQLRQAFNRYVNALDSSKFSEQARCLLELETLFKLGGADSTNWANIQALIEQRRRLIDCEYRGDMIKRMYLSRDEVLAFAEFLLEVVRHHIPDLAACDAISTEFAQVLGLPIPPAASDNTTPALPQPDP